MFGSRGVVVVTGFEVVEVVASSGGIVSVDVTDNDAGRRASLWRCTIMFIADARFSDESFALG